MDVPPVISHNFVFGLKADCNDNIHFGEDDTIIYPAGHMVVVYNPRTHTQQFLFGSDVNDSRFEKAEITCLTVSPNKRFCAIAERGVNHGTISIFDLHTFKRKRFLTCTDISCTEYSSICFTPDSSRLLALTAGPHAALVLWSWSSSKVLHIERLSSSGGYTNVSHAPSGNMFALTGSSGVLFAEQANSAPYIRIALSDESDPVVATCQYWLDANTLLVGAAKLGCAIYKQCRNVGILPIEELQKSPIVGITSVDDHLLVIAKNGNVCLLSNTLSTNTKHQSNTNTNTNTNNTSTSEHNGTSIDAPPVLHTDESKTNLDICWSAVKLGYAGWGDTPKCIKTSIEGEVLVTTEGGQLIRIWGWNTKQHATRTLHASKWGGVVGVADTTYSLQIDMSNNTNLALPSSSTSTSSTTTDASSSFSSTSLPSNTSMQFSQDKNAVNNVPTFIIQVQPVVAWNHHGSVTGMDLCVRTGTAITCGTDHTIRVWNMISRKLMFCLKFPDTPLSVALHPSGWLLLLSFTDRVCLCMLLHKSIKIVKEWQFKHVVELSFAPGGHLFAVSTTGVIYIIQTYTGKTLHALRGHVGTVRALVWNHDATSLFSASADGDVQERGVEKGSRIREFVQKGCRFLASAVSSDGTIVVSGDDHVLRQISSRDVRKALDAGVMLVQLQISSPPERMLFAGTSTGVVRSFGYPLTGDAKDFQAHCGSVTKLRLGKDDTTLVSTGEDGCVIFWTVRDHRVNTKLSSGQPLCTDVVVTVAGIEETRNAIQSLESRLKELSEEREAEDIRLSAEEEQILRKLTEDSVLKLENGRARIEAYRDEAHELDTEGQEKILAVQHQHNMELQAQASKYQKMFLEQLGKLQKLQDEHENIIEERKQRKAKLASQYYAEKKRLESTTEAELLRSKMQKGNAEVSLRLLIERFTEDRQQTEVDFDTEVELLTNQYQSRLEAERDNTLRLKGEAGLMAKKFNSLLTDREELSEAKNTLLLQEDELVNHIQILKGKVDEYKTAIESIDNHISERERQIFEFKRKNQELERHGFVIGFQVNELKQEMEPCEAAVSKLHKYVGTLSSELERLHKVNSKLEQDVLQVVDELKVSREHLKRTQGEVRVLLQQCNEMCQDVMASMEHLQNTSALRIHVLNLYAKYSSTDSDGGNVKTFEVSQEYKKHIEYLRTSVKALKAQVSKSTAAAKAEHYALIRENAGLVREVNNMRRELKKCNSGHKYTVPSVLQQEKQEKQQQQQGVSGTILPPLRNHSNQRKSQQNILTTNVHATTSTTDVFDQEDEYIKSNAWRVKQNEGIIHQLRLEIEERQLRLQRKQEE